MINDDLILAQQIINHNYKQKNSIYHDCSFIHMTTNEKINLYQKYLKNKSTILSVISSGDQILNSILEGNKEIDGYDISRFPKYFLELKMAGILGLEKSEFIDFFFNIDFHKDEYYDDVYWQIRNYLDIEYRNFWDNLLNFYDWSFITSSPLFSSQTVSLNSILENNIYLQNFNKMKNIVSSVNITYLTGNIYDIIKTNKKQYDLINLSSIIYYYKNYKNLLEKLNLTEDGIALTYLYSINDELIKYYENCEILPFKNHPEGIMIYKKKLV